MGGVKIAHLDRRVSLSPAMMFRVLLKSAHTHPNDADPLTGARYHRCVPDKGQLLRSDPGSSPPGQASTDTGVLHQIHLGIGEYSGVDHGRRAGRRKLWLAGLLTANVLTFWDSNGAISVTQAVQ